jgi:predicted phage terminase large subunit-like protein
MSTENPKKTLTHDQLEWALANREQVLVDLDREDCKDSLLQFIESSWAQLEPETPFVSGWPVQAICEHLEAVSKGQIKRLLINVPPGCMKSLTTEVFWPAWEWGPRQQPHLRYISASYDKGLVTRDLVRCRDLLTGEWYQKRWPMEFKGDQNLKTYYENDKSGWRFSASVGGALTGYRGDRIIVDDPHNVKSAESEVQRDEALRWFTETLPTRLNNQKDSVIVVVMQRLHQRDISGMIISELGDKWEKLILPMEFEEERRCSIKTTGFKDPRKKEGQLLWPARFDRDSVEELKEVFRAQGGTYAEAAQLQQRPAPRGGAMFKRDSFPIVDDIPRDQGGRFVRGWDLAASTGRTAAYTACVKLFMCQGRIYVCDVRRRRAGPAEVEQMIRQAADDDGRIVPISLPQDPGQAGKAQKARIASILHGWNVHFSPETGAKEDRAIPVAAQAEAGNVLLVRGSWNEAFLKEAENFPVGAYMDQIDALSRAYSYFLINKTPSLSLNPGKVIT